VTTESLRLHAVVHAEMNAVLNTNSASLSGAVRPHVTVSGLGWHLHDSSIKYRARAQPVCKVVQRMYVTLFPCNECAKLMIQAGIAEVVYYEVRYCLQP